MKAPKRYRVAFGLILLSISLGLIAVGLYADLAYAHGPNSLVIYDLASAVLMEDFSNLEIPT